MYKLNFSLKEIIINIVNRSLHLRKSYFNDHPNKKYTLSLIIDELFYVLKTGVSWRDNRGPINWRTLYGHFQKFVRYNIFRAVRILNAGFNDKKIFIALLIKEFLNSK